MFVNEYCIALVLVPILVAAFVFEPVFGIKFKSQQVGLVLLYSFVSALMALGTLIVAYIVSVSVSVGNLNSQNGADTSMAIIAAIAGLIIFVVLTRGNVSLLTIFAFRFPNYFELPSKKRSITLAAATVALLQIAVSWAAPLLSTLLNK